MSPTSRNKWLAWVPLVAIGAALMVLPASPAAAVGREGAGAPAAPDTVQTEPTVIRSFDAHTEPSGRAELNFVTPGVVAEVLVKPGDVVRRGQLLVRLDDRGDRKLLESLELEANSTLKIEAAQADLEQKRVELERKVQQQKYGGSSELEVQEARVAVVIREFQVRIEQLTREQRVLEASRQRVRVEQMTLVAPFDGVIERVDLEVGETPDMQRPPIAVVDGSPLWVNVFLPTGLALRLNVGDEVGIYYRALGESVTGRVIFLSPVADAASDTRKVRLEVDNPRGLPAGLAVRVDVPTIETAADRRDALDRWNPGTRWNEGNRGSAGRFGEAPGRLGGGDSGASEGLEAGPTAVR